jgi:hypothetical protein
MLFSVKLTFISVFSSLPPFPPTSPPQPSATCEERADVPVVKTTGTETTLNHLKPASPAEDEVVERDADVLVEDFEEAFRDVVVAKLLWERRVSAG